KRRRPLNIDLISLYMQFPKLRRILAVVCGLIVASVISPVVFAQQPLDWDQAKARFIANNPALKADADNVDEMKAEEITAYLRPNPQFTLLADGTQIAPPNGVWTPFTGPYD